jgi:hypothetical protein
MTMATQRRLDVMGLVVSTDATREAESHMRSVLTLAVATVALLAAASLAEGETSPGLDSGLGSEPDGSAGSDAGTEPDGEPGSDSGVLPDSGLASDSGNQWGCARGANWCLYGGATLAAASLTDMAITSQHGGQTAHQIASLIVPTGGFRRVITDEVSVDLGLLTTLGTISSKLSTDISPTATNLDTQCASPASNFVSKLPCEGNATLKPPLAAYAALSFVQGENLSAFSVGAMAGLARTDFDPEVHPFIGLFLGLGSAYVTFPLDHARENPSQPAATKNSSSNKTHQSVHSALPTTGGGHTPSTTLTATTTATTTPATPPNKKSNGTTKSTGQP